MEDADISVEGEIGEDVDVHVNVDDSDAFIGKSGRLVVVDGAFCCW